jgi:hypothetical protein
MTNEPQQPIRRAFADREGDNHIDVRVGGADFVISWRSGEIPYVRAYAFAWPMFVQCSDIFVWLAENPYANRSDVASALVGLGYVDETHQPLSRCDAELT